MAPAPSASSSAIERPPGEEAQTIVASQPCSAARASSARAAASLFTSAPTSTAGGPAGALGGGGAVGGAGSAGAVGGGEYRGPPVESGRGELRRRVAVVEPGRRQAVLLAAEEVAGKALPERSRLLHAGRGDDSGHAPLQQRDEGRRRPQDVHHGERGAGVLYQARQQRYVNAQSG